jgi:hypothetical protein
MTLPIANNREDGGRLLREYWMERARQHPDPKYGWLLSWAELDEWNKETDRYMWERIVAPYNEANMQLHIRIQRLERDLEARESKIQGLEDYIRYVGEYD